MADPTALVDPTDPYGQNKAKRQRQIADALRQQGEAPVGGGEMVSGHYVAPAWSQQLAKLASTLGSVYAGSKADTAEEASKAKIAEATSQWAGGAPQSVPAQVMPGETKEGLYGPETFGPTTLSAAQPVTGGQVLKHSLAGMQIPGNEKAAQMYQTGAMADMSREDTQTHRTEQAQLAAKAKLESEQAQRQHDLKQLTMRLEDRGLDRTLQESLKQQQMALQAQIAQGNQALQQQGLALRQQGLDIQRQGLELKQETAKTKADAKAKEVGLSEAGIGDAIKALDKAKDTAATGYLGGIVQEYAPGGASIVNDWRDKATNDAIQKLTYWTDEIRHGRFGSALTNSEKASAAQYLPGPYDNLQQTKDKANGLQAILKLNAQRLKGTAPMPKELGGPEGTPTTASSGQVTQAPAGAGPVSVRTQADVDKLKSGTRFTGPDGKTYTKD